MEFCAIYPRGPHAHPSGPLYSDGEEGHIKTRSECAPTIGRIETEGTESTERSSTSGESATALTRGPDCTDPADSKLEQNPSDFSASRDLREEGLIKGQTI